MFPRGGHGRGDLPALPAVLPLLLRFPRGVLMPFVLARAVTTGSLVSRLIREYTGSCVSHVEYRLDAGWMPLITRYLATKPANSDAVWAGIKRLVPGDFGTLGAHVGDGIQIRTSTYDTFTLIHNFRVQVTQTQFESIVGAALKAVGDRYAKRVILGDFLHENLTEPNEYDCSEMLNDTMGAGGRYLQNPIDGSGLITPRDILMSPLIELE
jgi:hypothetical protein